MAFFNDLGRKVSEAGQSAIQKTKELSDTTRLNSMISDEEKRINNSYFQIGKLYASIHKNDYEEDFSFMISSISESEAKIRDYKKQIQDIKGVQYCEKCGAEVPKDAVFCSSCGAKMPKKQTDNADDFTKCQNCGAIVKKGMRFCTACGKPMELIPAASDPVEPDVDTVAEPEKERICPKCGTELEEDAIFCTECGTKID